MRTLSVLFALVIATPVLAAETTVSKIPVAGKTPTVQKPPLHEHPTLVKMLQRSNAMRQSRGLAPHRISPSLTKAAQNHAWYMAHSGAFSHESNGGPMYRAQRYGYRNLVRENIA